MVLSQIRILIHFLLLFCYQLIQFCNRLIGQGEHDPVSFVLFRHLKNLLNGDDERSSGNTTLKLRHVAGRFLANSCNDPGQNVHVFGQVKDQNKLSCDPIYLKNHFGWIDHFLRPFGTRLKSSKSIR